MAKKHPRKMIRDAVVALLLNHTQVKDRVFANRYTPLWEVELPCICIYFKKDLPERRAQGCYFYRRDNTLTVEIMVKASPAMDDEIDAIALEIEDIILPNIFTRDPMSGTETASFSDMGETDISLSQDGSKLFGSGRITFEIQYQQDIPELKAGVTDFLTVMARINVEDPATEGIAGATETDVFTVQP